MATDTNSAFIEALKAVPVIGTIEVDCDHPDALIIRAWNKRQEAVATLESRGRFYDADDHSPAEMQLFDTLEDGIPLMETATPLGLLPKLWIALAHAGGACNTDEARAESDTIRRADFDEVATFVNRLDFDEQVIFAVIRDILNGQRFEQLVPMRKAANDQQLDHRAAVEEPARRADAISHAQEWLRKNHPRFGGKAT